MERLIFHIDVNSAFLSWESARRVSQGIPEKMWPLPVRNLLFLGNSLLCGRRSKETDRVHTLFPDEIPEKMWPLPVRNLLFLGKASEQKLLNQGIRTIGDLAREREANVQLWLGEKPEHR